MCIVLEQKQAPQSMYLVAEQQLPTEVFFAKCLYDQHLESNHRGMIRNEHCWKVPPTLHKGRG